MSAATPDRVRWSRASWALAVCSDRAVSGGLTPTQFRVLVDLGMLASDRGIVESTQDDLGAACGVTSRTIRSALKQFERLGLITRLETGRGRGDGSSTTSVYQLQSTQPEGCRS